MNINNIDPLISYDIRQGIGWGIELLLGLVLIIFFIRNLWLTIRLNHDAHDYPKKAAYIAISVAWVRFLGVTAFGVALFLWLIGLQVSEVIIPNLDGQIGAILELLCCYFQGAYSLTCGIIIWVFATIQCSLIELLMKQKEAKRKN